MAHNMHLWMTEMDYTLFEEFHDLLNTDCRPPSFNVNLVDGEFLHKPHQVFLSVTINPSLKLIYNVVRISDTPGSGINLSIG
jgi:hypothetical protein